MQLRYGHLRFGDLRIFGGVRIGDAIEGAGFGDYGDYSPVWLCVADGA